MRFVLESGSFPGYRQFPGGTQFAQWTFVHDPRAAGFTSQRAALVLFGVIVILGGRTNFGWVGRRGSRRRRRSLAL
jgi:hypothetical protein